MIPTTLVLSLGFSEGMSVSLVVFNLRANKYNNFHQRFSSLYREQLLRQKFSIRMGSLENLLCWETSL